MLKFSCAFFFSGLNFSVFRRLFACLYIVHNLLLLQGLIFEEVLANEFHISLLLYAMALCAFKVFDNMPDSTNNILLCFFLRTFFTIFLYILQSLEDASS
ncbi:hypothetical protein AABB24_009469 [Solanum stoloniferum]|uniref:Uncharacterized protein n=1 Tax=Solanum stoloniferum TaxID=62892 RepID=A0ABD2UIM3_9SOLN